MENNKFTIPVSEEQVNYLQRLGYDVDSKIFIIDRLFANHANDDNTQLFDSIPYKHYIKEYEQAYTMWELAKSDFEQQYLKPIVQEKTGLANPIFNWNIADYSSLECEITLL